jgi:spermidine synthase
MTKARIMTREKKAPEPDYSPITSFTRISALTIFAVSGFCAMAYEVIWTQLLGLIVGPTTYSFSIVLVTFITGLALGSLFFGWLSDRVNNTMQLLLLTQIVAALFSLLLSQILGNSQIFFAKLIYHFKDHFTLLALLKASILFAFMFFPTFCLGATFPLVGKIYTRSLAQTGRSIGFAYAINSGGAILGSFIAGFLLIPLLGKEQGLRPVIALQLFTSLFIGSFLLWKAREHLKKGILTVLPALLVLILLLYFPHWDRQMLSVGKYHRFNHPEIRDVGWVEALLSGTRLFSQHVDGEVVYFGEGIAGFTTVLKTEFDILGNKGYALYSSGKPEASSQLDMDTQTLSAHVPLLFHKDPKTVLVVGLASGITAGEILHYPVKRLDVIDINRKVVGASHFFRPWNNNVLSNTKTNLIIQDARAHMALSDHKYDVISAEPSNPWMAGLATLFTKDFFTLVKDRLKEDGIFAQFIHTYQMDWDTFALVGRTFSQVFPNSLLLRTNPSSLGPDFLLLGFKSNAEFKELVAPNAVRFASRSKNVTLNDPRVLYPLVVTEDLRNLFGDGPVNTDAMPLLEFSAPKLLHTDDPTIKRKLSTNRRLRQETMEMIMQGATDVDLGIDIAAFTLSLIRPEMAFQNPVDLSKASDSQKARLKSIVKNFCSNNIVSDFSLFGDEDLTKICITTQIESVIQRLPLAEDKALLYLQLGILHSDLGKVDDALRHFDKALQTDPLNPDANYNLALFLSKLDRTADAIKHYSEALRLKPYYEYAANNLAWIYSTHENPSFRNGEKAVKLAELICDMGGCSDPAMLDTLAAAYAETGRFQDALRTAREAIDLAELSGDENLAKEIKNRIRLYQSNRPFRENPPDTAP